MTDYNDIYGQDIKLDSRFQVCVAANGEVVLTEGIETAVQDIRIRLRTPKGSLFYDEDYGCEVHDYYYAENTKANRRAIEQAIWGCIDSDPLVKFNSTSVSIRSYDETGVVIDASFQFHGDDVDRNLVISILKDNDMEMVIDDVTY